MKLLTFLLLLIAINCSGQPGKDNKLDTVKWARWLTPFQSRVQDTTERIIYFEVFIGGNGTRPYPAAYKKRDSAWVVKDTAETLRLVLQYLDRQYNLTASQTKR